MDYRGVLVGLGNPGPKYDGTRHNTGFLLLDRLLDMAHLDGSVSEQNGKRFDCELWRVQLEALGGTWLVAKPLTYMNLSGQCVQPLLAWHKMSPRDLVVVHDELDLPPGALRFKFGGGNAGHNGLKSITERLGTPDFYRLRLGIGQLGLIIRLLRLLLLQGRLYVRLLVLILRFQGFHICLFLLQLIEKLFYLRLCFLILLQHLAVLGLNLFGEIRPVQEIRKAVCLKKKRQVIHVAFLIYVLDPKLHSLVLLFFPLLGSLIICLRLSKLLFLRRQIRFQKLNIQHQIHEIRIQGVNFRQNAVSLALDRLHLLIDGVQLLLGLCLLLLNL